MTVSSIYVRTDANQLRTLAQQLRAAQALAQATGGHADRAIVPTP